MPLITRFGAVILAAGGSSRLGRPKQLLELGGQTLLAWAASEVLAAEAYPVVVVVGSEAERIGAAVRSLSVILASNPNWGEGMASSIRVGVEALQAAAPDLDAILIALCDQPAFSAGTVRQLLEAVNGEGKTIAAARYEGRHGAPVLFRREHFSELGRLSGDRGARDLIAQDTGRLASVDLPELAFDIDLPADLARWKQSLPDVPGRSG